MKKLKCLSLCLSVGLSMARVAWCSEDAGQKTPAGLAKEVQRAVMSLEQGVKQYEGRPHPVAMITYSSFTGEFTRQEGLCNRAIDYVRKSATSGLQASEVLTQASAVLEKFQTIMNKMQDNRDVYPLSPDNKMELIKIQDDLNKVLRSVRQTRFYMRDKKDAKKVLINTVNGKEVGLGAWVQQIIAHLLEANKGELVREQMAPVVRD